MATVEAYALNDGTKRYQVRYRKPDGRQTKKRGFKRKIDAERFAATVEVSKMRGEYVAPQLGMVTVGSIADEWLMKKQAQVAPSNYRTLDSAWRIHVAPKWGAVRLADINLNNVEAWISALRDAGKGATTVIRAYGVLSGILDTAVKDKRLSSNPARGVDNLPRKTAKRRVYLTVSDVARLAGESGPHETLVYVLAYCGIRWGEAIALRVRDIEFLKRRITVHDNAVQLGVEHVEGLTKSRKERAVPVPAFVLERLAKQCEGKHRDDLVFPGPDGKYLPRPKSDGGWFGGAVKRAGVQKITPHDLRHTCASIAISAGVNVLALARMLGHGDPSVTLRVYADLFDTDLDKVAEALHGAHVSECAQNVPTDSVSTTPPA